MRYLYGDSSEFPLNQNFIETAAAATDVAVALLRVDELIARAKKTAEDANNAATSELSDLDELARRVDEALARREHLSTATSKVAEEVAQQARAHFDRARAGVRSWRDATIRKAKQGTGPASIMDPIHRFVVQHELPYTTWGLRWKAGQDDEPVQAQVYAIMQRGLTATIGVAIPSRHVWSQPVRVSQLDKGLIVQLMGKSWLGKDKLCDEQLDKYYITRVTRTSEREMMVLSKKPKDPSPGLRISLREGDKKRVTIVRIDESDNPIGEMVGLVGSNADTVQRLWAHVKRTIGDLIRHRAQLLAASLNGKSILELETPAPVAEVIVQSVAPLIRDMNRHSRTPGELQLKRDLGDGRREELFISHDEIIRKYSHLKSKSRRVFDAYGLSGSGQLTASAPPPSQPALPASVPASQPMLLAAPASQPASSPAEGTTQQVVHSMSDQQRLILQHRAARLRDAQERARQEEERRLAAVREAAQAVRRAAKTGSALPLPSQPPPVPARLLSSHSGSSFPPPLSQSQSSDAPPSSLPAPSQPPQRNLVASAMSVSAVSLPSVPPPPLLPSEARQRAHTPSDVVESVPSSQAPPSQSMFRLPPPSAPPRRAKRLQAANG